MTHEATRDRMRSPSINFPRSAEEAAQALIHATRKALFESGGTLTREFTTDSGLGTTRRPDQAQWLNEQQSIIRARIEDMLDEMDICTRSAS